LHRGVSGGTQLYKFGCNSATAVMDQLAVPAGLRSYITGLFGSKLAFTNTTVLPCDAGRAGETALS
jgi:hypothetical protein